MENFKEYAEIAIKRCNLGSYNKLSKELKINQSCIVNMKAGKILPSARTMLKLAKLAGVPEEQALIDLATWANADKPEIADIYKRISKMILAASFILLILGAFCPAQAYPQSGAECILCCIVFAYLIDFTCFLFFRKKLTCLCY